MGDNSQLLNSVHGILFRPWDSSNAQQHLKAKVETEGKEVLKKALPSMASDHSGTVIRQPKSCVKPMVGSMSSAAIRSSLSSNLHLGMPHSSFFSLLGPAAAAFNVKSTSAMPLSHPSCQPTFKFNGLLSGNANFHPNVTSDNLSFPNIFPYNMSALSNPSCLADIMPLPYKNTSSLTCGGSSTHVLNKVNEQSKSMDKQSKKQRPKRFQCPHCQVSFSNNGQLKGHIRIHTGERPFVCDQANCNKTFTRNEELTRHKRIHTGLRPFACSVCNKRFGRKDHLKKHVKTHQRPPPIAVPLSLNAASLTAYSAAAAAAFGYPWL